MKRTHLLLTILFFASTLTGLAQNNNETSTTATYQGKKLFQVSPAKPTDQITLPYASADAIVQIHNRAGEQVLEQAYQQQIDISSIPSGVYIVEVSFTSGEKSMGRLVKE